MTIPGCDRIGLVELTDYAAGELAAADAAAIEEHLFACADCGARAAEFDAVVRAIPPALRSADVGGFVTDDVLNRLAREGVRVRTFALSPGAIVPCAVWADDELMVLRLRGDFGSATEFTLSERAAGTELVRVSGQIVPSADGEVIYTLPAKSIRHLPVVNVEILLTAVDAGKEREVGSYTLVHGGSLHR
ncbi:putative transmembrane transcriptional regulator (anti-sigma factor) [Luteitalea pratensis]|uniref:Putative transmembrane transcriptional regulator (Anti-sigma factor) n=1 Tax=Luteitalea pratensis TaxID=1855912 RepID=A0A143PFZ9_LUTPR|nr:zf-HC2 domain-containing protein [Luteitalea pratensis]AMY06998.1 putative transmembrane transcriptional regulator (anti-sigma factor) [Luteitalea pratensis]